MAAVVRAEALDFAADLPEAARKTIAARLAEDPKSTRRVYAALAHKVWSLLVERRFDEEIRDWHELVRGVKAHVRNSDVAAAERLTALADLLRESISLAQTSPAGDVASRPRARQILEILNCTHGFVARRTLQQELAIGGSHLSNVLTQLVAHGLVDRREKGKEAEFRITVFGRQKIGADGVRPDIAGEESEGFATLAARVQDLTRDALLQHLVVVGSNNTLRDFPMMRARKLDAMSVLCFDDTYIDNTAYVAHRSTHLIQPSEAWTFFSHRKPAPAQKSR